MEKNIDEAIKHLRMAAELGNEEAKAKLGDLICSLDGSFSDLLKRFYNDGYNDAKSDKNNKYVKEEIKKVVSFEDIKVGDIIKFGNYLQNANDKKEPIEWRVLAVEKRKALLISQYALDCYEYNDKSEDISWEQCIIRQWLNNEFINSAFTKDEQEMIQLSNVRPDVNTRYRTNQGKSTKDKIFLISVKEAEKYFKSNEERQCKLTKYVFDYRNHYYRYNQWCGWLLRSLGVTSNLATYVESDGTIDYYGVFINDARFGVRPSMWIKVNS